MAEGSLQGGKLPEACRYGGETISPLGLGNFIITDLSGPGLLEPMNTTSWGHLIYKCLEPAPPTRLRPVLCYTVHLNYFDNRWACARKPSVMWKSSQPGSGIHQERQVLSSMSVCSVEARRQEQARLVAQG